MAGLLYSADFRSIDPDDYASLKGIDLGSLTFVVFPAWGIPALPRAQDHPHSKDLTAAIKEWCLVLEGIVGHPLDIDPSELALLQVSEPEPATKQQLLESLSKVGREGLQTQTRPWDTLFLPIEPDPEDFATFGGSLR